MASLSAFHGRVAAMLDPVALPADGDAAFDPAGDTAHGDPNPPDTKADALTVSDGSNNVGGRGAGAEAAVADHTRTRFVSRAWIDAWVHGEEVAIANAGLRCTHGGMDPDRVVDAFFMPGPVWDLLSGRYGADHDLGLGTVRGVWVVALPVYCCLSFVFGGGLQSWTCAAFTNSTARFYFGGGKVCRECVVDGWRQRRGESALEVERAGLAALAEADGDFEGGFFVAKKWYNKYVWVANGNPTRSHGQGFVFLSV